MVKRLFLITCFVVFASGHALAQTITVGNVDPGPYAPGSSIGVPVSVTGPCVNTSTTYDLYLSNAAGSFASNTLIGTFSNFYPTFVNGVIPPGTPAGNGYKVKVVSINPAITSTISGPFSINTGAGVIAAINSQVINSVYPEVFGTCSGINNTTYTFVNQSTAGATVSAAFFNELSKVSEGSIIPTTAGTPFTAKDAHYSITVKAINNGIVGTKCYLLINNAVNTSFGVTGSNTICLSGGGNLTYNVDISSASGIQNNFPGLIYTISWGDGKTTSLTLCEIIALGGQITHTFITSSCGNSPNGVSNAFEVDFQPSDAYCGKVGTQVTSYAKVITAPLNKFLDPLFACTNAPVTFVNTSDPGQNPNNTSSNCVELNALYTWMVDGVIAGSNYKINQPFTTTFTSNGTHSITLHLQNSNALCSATDLVQNICVQNPPQPKFFLPVNTGCVPITITPTDQSVIDASCNVANKYVWTITGPGNVGYANGTTANSKQPQFIFPASGAYQLKLGITSAGCGTITTSVQTITVDSTAVAQLSPDVILCGTNQTFTFNPKAGPTQTILSGNPTNNPGTYAWTITGGAFTFTGGTSAASQYPQVNFTSIATYTITVINSNVCGSATATQHITFNQAPTVNAGPPQTFCANNQVLLNGTVIGNVNSTQWTGGTGTFTPNANTLTASYTPSAAEITAGTVTLTMIAATSLPAPCNNVTSSVTLTITSPDVVTSAPSVSVCSGAAINYQVTATIPNSIFSWTVDPAKTTATASGYNAKGSGTVINDVIINSDPNNYATVTYNITAATSTGCASSTFVLTVTIAPKQTIAKFTQDVKSGCDNLIVQFTNASVPSNSTYTWDFGDGSLTSNVTNPIHTFAPRTDGKDTIYTVTLSTVSNCGSSLPFISTVTVRPKIPVAFISPKQIIGCSPFTLAVDNFSPGANQSYTYYLYNGPTLVQQITATDKSEVRFNPVVTPVTVVYTLYMVATGFCGNTGQSNIIPITISAANVVAQMFIENGTNKGCVPFTPTFINNSLGGDSYYYTIYDVNHIVVDRRQGGTAPLPYTFNTPGTFYVTVTAMNSCTTLESSPALQINVYINPIPQFAADVTAGCKNLLVTYTNQTADDPNMQAKSLLYDWDFGDNSPHSFAFAPPPHNYNFKNSPFTVTLTATNSATGCSTTITKSTYINVISPPATQFTETPDSVASIPDYHFSFTDQTTVNPISWQWSFGDGKASTLENPSHTYADTGIYKVTLTTSSEAGCDSTISHFVRITGIPGQLFLPNAFEPGGNTPELKTFMAKGSGIKVWRMQIFNNYSQLIWETTSLDSKGMPVNGWDGTFNGVPAQQGVYVWQVSATFINGSEWKGNVINGSVPKRTGTIHLIR